MATEVAGESSAMKVNRAECSGKRQFNDAGPSHGKCLVISALLKLFESILKTILVA